jgi:hypothetical protein
VNTGSLHLNGPFGHGTALLIEIPVYPEPEASALSSSAMAARLNAGYSPITASRNPASRASRHSRLPLAPMTGGRMPRHRWKHPKNDVQPRVRASVRAACTVPEGQEGSE